MYKHLGPNLSTTTEMGCRQCLPLSVVQLKGKHCRKPHCHYSNGVVDTFRQYTWNSSTYLTYKQRAYSFAQLASMYLCVTSPVGQKQAARAGWQAVSRHGGVTVYSGDVWKLLFVVSSSFLLTSPSTEIDSAHLSGRSGEKSVSTPFENVAEKHGWGHSSGGVGAGGAPHTGHFTENQPLIL